ncbi:MAG: reverse transcriptase family protein [Pirellulales bacterium]
MNPYRNTAQALATTFLAGQLEVDGLDERGSHLLGRQWRWIRPLAQRIESRFGGMARPRIVVLTNFIMDDRGFHRATEKHKIRPVNRLGCTPIMGPTPKAATWQVPAICTTGELAQWLQLTPGELDWMADLRSLESKQPRQRLRHYHYRPLAKNHGNIRLIESPKQRLKAVQHQIHTEILSHIPPHEAAHGFRRGRSIRTFAEPHTGKSVVLKLDLQDFFPSISFAWVQALFRTAGYPERVADSLAGLCTNATPLDTWENDQFPAALENIRRVRWLYAKPHLPQGAPTSPAIANLCAYWLDCRLFGLAHAAGAVYTRYADDLAFSGNESFARVAKRFQVHVCATAMEEGFQVHHRKTRVMRQGVCQRLAGVVVNKHLNLPRNDLDRLKATLTNCIRYGVKGQNRTGHADFQGHLNGRISFVESINPSRGHKLRQMFDQIEW